MKSHEFIKELVGEKNIRKEMSEFIWLIFYITFLYYIPNQIKKTTKF